MGGYPESIRGIPDRNIPWLDDTPEFMCENCEFHTDNESDIKDWSEESESWKCPNCGIWNYP